MWRTQPREPALTSCFSSCSAWLRVMFLEYHLGQGHSRQGRAPATAVPSPADPGPELNVERP